MNWTRPAIRGVLTGVDRLYRRIFALVPVGPVLLVGVSAPGRRALLAPRVPSTVQGAIGRLHIDNGWAARIGSNERNRYAVQFALLLRKSLRELALQVKDGGAFCNVAMFEGITWFAPHGKRVGFTCEPIPGGIRQRLLTRHFRLLVWAFSPPRERHTSSDTMPRRFSVTRRELLEHFGDQKCG